MNPADESTAFNFLIQKGMTAEEVAKRQGVTTRFVEQRVRLAELAPSVFQALAAGEITLGVAQAYAVTRSEERRVGKECVITCRSRWSPLHLKKTKPLYLN